MKPVDKIKKETLINSSRKELFCFYLLGFGIACCFGWLSFWNLFEQDLFMHLRAGDEILSTGSIPSVEHWSHTAFGTPWYDFQWMTSILFVGVRNLFGTLGALSWLRSVLVVIWIFELAVIVRSSLKKSLFWGSGLFLILPWFYLMNWIRMQLRADLLGILFFSALVILALSQLNQRKKNILSLFTLFCWAQFHAGTVWVGILYFNLSMLFTSDYVLDQGILSNLKQKWRWILGASVMFFLTPVHYHIIPELISTFDVVGNPDLQPFTWSFLSYQNGGWTYQAWALFSFIVVCNLLWHFKHPSLWNEQIGPYKNRKFVIILGVILFALFFDRMRTIPYLTISLMPFFLNGLENFFDYFYNRKKFIALASLVVLVIPVWFYILPDHRKLAEPLGAQVSETWFPVKSVEFIKTHRPQGKLYNFFNFGGYLLDQLREYPNFVDGRETPFIELEKTRRSASHNPDSWAAFLNLHQINLVIENRPTGNLVKEFLKFYPSEQWARVFTDLASTVYVRRIPEHAELIRKFESGGGELHFQSGGKQDLPSQEEIQKLLEQAREQIKKQNKNE